MSIRIKLKDWDIVVLPLEGKVLGRRRNKDGTRKEIFTSQTRGGYHHTHGGRTTYPEQYRSRLVWFAVNGPIPEGMQINHKNHDRADDNISNLELVTPAENSRYTRKSKDNTSGYKGVSYNKQHNKYEAYIRVNYKKKYLGIYTCPIEAARAYDRAAREHFGKYAVLNFPDEASS
jgi:hypothetical protein